MRKQKDLEDVLGELQELYKTLEERIAELVLKAFNKGYERGIKDERAEIYRRYPRNQGGNGRPRNTPARPRERPLSK